MCAKLAEEMAEKSANVGHRKGRKRKRTEKGWDWDKEIGEETLLGKQPSDVLSITGPDSGKNDMQTSKSQKENPPQKKKKVSKTREKQQEKPQEKQMQKTAECIAGKKNRKNKKKTKRRKLLRSSLEKKKQEKPKEKQVQKTAEIVARKTLATEFFSNVVNSSDVMLRNRRQMQHQ